VVVYTRNGSEFVKTGSLRPGTKAVRVAIDGRASPSIWEAKKALQVVADAIQGGYARANRYEIIEAKVNSLSLSFVARRTAKLLKPRNKKPSLTGRPRVRFFAQQSEYGRYSLIDALNHDLSTVSENEELRRWFENLFGTYRQEKTLGRQILERFWEEDR
jgi:hypothetical protein